MAWAPTAAGTLMVLAILTARRTPRAQRIPTPPRRAIRLLRSLSMALSLRVFPDTGHQYFTRPLSVLISQKKEAELLKVVQQHWRFKPWSSKYPWVRFALDQRENQPFITIAVETNMGPPSRGTLFNVEAC